MARPREFDETDVIDRARTAFWSNGVAATSISTISEATGLSVGSLYKAFKSKDQLCALTLDDYLSRARADLKAAIEQAPTPWLGVRAWLDASVEQAADRSPTRGCYAVEVAAERAATDDEVRALLVDHDRKLRKLVARGVRSTVEEGELSGEADNMARLICTTLNGLQVEARKGISRASAQRTIDTLLDALGLP